jgi:outer membrane protein
MNEFKKPLYAAAVSVCLMASGSAYADTLFGIYAGAGTWQQSFAGDVTSGVTVVDIEDDLALDDDSNVVFYAALEHGVPVLPNIRAQHFSMDVDGENVLSRTIEFNGETFAIDEAVATTVDLTQTDAVLYYELLDNVVSLDVGMAVSMIEGSIEVVSSTDGAEADFDEVIPLLYAKARADLPFSGLWIGAEAQGISYDDNSLVEYNAQVGWESDLGLGVEAGWRGVQMELDAFDDVQSAEVDVTGPYAAINFHF